jgi:hypothetical protein
MQSDHPAAGPQSEDLRRGDLRPGAAGPAEPGASRTDRAARRTDDEVRDVVFGSLSSRRLLDADVPQLDGLAGPDDEIPDDAAGEDPVGRARD